MGEIFYKYRPVGSLGNLGRMLGLTLPQLRRLADRANRLYRPGPSFEKSDGSTRQTWNAMPQLKAAQGRIKNLILSRVEYPKYLQGGLRNRDYKRNAHLHRRSRIVINEDIETFFPSISADAIFDIWRNFFHFPQPVAQCLTKLTTKDGRVPEGARTSTHLANLVLWRLENSLVKRFQQRGVRYSRHVDDITASARHAVTKEDKTQIIGSIFGMLSQHGLKPKRSKHSIATRGQAMRVNRLVVNQHPTLGKKERARIRSAVHEFEQLAKSDVSQHEMITAYHRISGRVGTLKRFHPAQADKLKARLDSIFDRHV